MIGMKVFKLQSVLIYDAGSALGVTLLNSRKSPRRLQLKKRREYTQPINGVDN
jgi:hypothetical protein